MAVCKYCGKEFTKKHNREVYCNSNCKIEARREQKLKDNLRRNKLNKNQKIQTYGQYKNNLGTGSLGMHRDTDENRELIAIQNQMKMLGIKPSTFF